ncbi:hypothetical protein J6590_068428 [Homalodisca vitripennis]|nr:hypothetical protein J6590_068428 [Homalodisca vitripennis]
MKHRELLHPPHPHPPTIIHPHAKRARGSESDKLKAGAWGAAAGQSTWETMTHQSLPVSGFILTISVCHVIVHSVTLEIYTRCSYTDYNM